MTPEVYWIWMQLVFGYGNIRSDQILESISSPEELYTMGAAERHARRVLTLREETRLTATQLEDAQRILEHCRRLGIAILTPECEDYPEPLRHIDAKPLVLYTQGSPNCLLGRLAIGMVGTRHSTLYGRDVADLLARELAACGAVVVSGLAQGIDAISHTGALKGGGKTVAVLGCGLDQNYPVVNHDLRELIVKNGAVISEYPPGTTPIPRNFPIRNRIISGLSVGVVVVEGERRSGSLITAGHALTQGRDVFALPGSVFQSTSSGTHSLIRQGAIPLTCTRDLLEEYLPVWADTLDSDAMDALPLDRFIKRGDSTANETPMPPKAGKATKQPETKAERRPAPQFLTLTQQKVYAAIGVLPKTVDRMTAELGVPVKDVLAALTQLEIYGLVRALPGRQYVIEPA